MRVRVRVRPRPWARARVDIRRAAATSTGAPSASASPRSRDSRTPRLAERLGSSNVIGLPSRSGAISRAEIEGGPAGEGQAEVVAEGEGVRTMPRGDEDACLLVDNMQAK